MANTIQHRGVKVCLYSYCKLFSFTRVIIRLVILQFFYFCFHSSCIVWYVIMSITILKVLSCLYCFEIVNENKFVFDYSRFSYSIFNLFILSSHSFIKIQTTFVIKYIGQCCFFFLIQYFKMIYFWYICFRFCNLSYLKLILRSHFCHRMSCMCVWLLKSTSILCTTY